MLKSGSNKVDQWGPVDARVLYPSFWFRPVAEAGRQAWLAVWPDEFIHIFQNGKLTVYWNRREMEKRGSAVIKRWFIPEDKRARVWQEYRRQIKLLRAAAGRMIKTKSWSKTSLAKAISVWYQLMYDFWSVVLIPELANFAAPAYFAKAIARYVPARVMPEVMETMLAPTKLGFHQQNELELLRLFRAGYSSKDELDKYARRWQWLENSYYQSKNLSAAYFAKKLKGKGRDQINKRIEAIIDFSKRAKAKKAEIVRRYKLPRSVKDLADILSFSIWWQDHRKAVLCRAQNITDTLSREACRNYKIKPADLLYYTAEDWLSLGKSGKLLSNQELEQRKKLFVVYLKGEKLFNFSGRSAEKFLPKQKNLSGSARIIKGVVASRGQGIIRGRVAILHSPREGGKMKKGYILVAPMTEPDFVPLMRKARAVITDVGGLMSHAAILSRELGIPAIVGTRVATQVLRDGDRVEVDATKGIIRKV